MLLAYCFLGSRNALFCDWSYSRCDKKGEKYVSLPKKDLHLCPNCGLMGMAWEPLQISYALGFLSNIPKCNSLNCMKKIINHFGLECHTYRLIDFNPLTQKFNHQKTNIVIAIRSFFSLYYKETIIITQNDKELLAKGMGNCWG